MNCWNTAIVVESIFDGQNYQEVLVRCANGKVQKAYAHTEGMRSLEPGDRVLVQAESDRCVNDIQKYYRIDAVLLNPFPGSGNVLKPRYKTRSERSGFIR
jgi:hypothetical protein